MRYVFLHSLRLYKLERSNGSGNWRARSVRVTAAVRQKEKKNHWITNDTYKKPFPHNTDRYLVYKR